jgi:hypothetical protein
MLASGSAHYLPKMQLRLLHGGEAWVGLAAAHLRFELRPGSAYAAA